MYLERAHPAFLTTLVVLVLVDFKKKQNLVANFDKKMCISMQLLKNGFIESLIQ